MVRDAAARGLKFNPYPRGGRTACPPAAIIRAVFFASTRTNDITLAACATRRREPGIWLFESAIAGSSKTESGRAHLPTGRSELIRRGRSKPCYDKNPHVSTWNIGTKAKKPTREIKRAPPPPPPLKKTKTRFPANQALWRRLFCQNRDEHSVYVALSKL